MPAGDDSARAPDGIRGAALADLAVHAGGVRARLLTDDGVISCSFALPRGSEHAARHAVALHGHSPCCRQGATRLVPLLSQAAALAGGHRPWLVLAAGPPAQVWLRVRGPFGKVDLPVEAVDALCLLASDAVPLGVAEGGRVDGARRQGSEEE